MAEQVVAHLLVGNASLADFGQFIGRIEHLALALGFIGEKFRQADGYAVQLPLQGAQRCVDLRCFELGDEAVGDAGPLGQLPLRISMRFPDRAQPQADVLREVIRV